LVDTLQAQSKIFIMVIGKTEWHGGGFSSECWWETLGIISNTDSCNNRFLDLEETLETILFHSFG
jgi:hypothetical protein